MSARRQAARPVRGYFDEETSSEAAHYGGRCDEIRVYRQQRLARHYHAHVEPVASRRLLAAELLS